MSLNQHVRAILSRWSLGWPDALACAFAAALAWKLAQLLFGHGQPIFASVAAVVCLAPGIPSRAGQALNMMLGLVTGIAVGEALLLLAPHMETTMLIGLVVLVAIMAAISFGLLPVIAIQGGVSALLVLALGPDAAGQVRFFDALAGTAVGLLFSQILLTPDPVALVDAAARKMLGDVGAALGGLAQALEAESPAQAAASRAKLIEARDSVNVLHVRMASAANMARWSLRGRLRRSATLRISEVYACRAVVLHAAALVLADALTAGLQRGLRPPAALAARVNNVSAALQALGAGKPVRPERAREEGCDADSDWRPCLESLEALERLARALEQEIGAGEPRPAQARP